MKKNSDWKKTRKRKIVLWWVLSLAAAASIAAVVFTAFRYGIIRLPERNEGLFAGRKTVRLWYSDKALDEFLSGAELYFNENNRDLRLDISYVENAAFLEQVNRASIEADEDLPDLFITGNDQLEMAYLSGLAVPVSGDLHFEDPPFFPEAAVNAVTCDDKIVGWPMYFDTAAFVYDPALLGEGDAVPATVTGLIGFSNLYNAPAGVTDVFKWDVNDIFYNYGFIGSAIEAGGAGGDDPQMLRIYDRDVLKCLQTYQQLSSYFSIDASEVDYETVVNDFLHGKYVFSLATTDILKRFETAELLQDEGLIGDFGSAPLPDVTDTLRAKGMSVTYALVLNGYSAEQEAASAVAKYLVYDRGAMLYEQSGKLPCARPAALTDPRMDGFYAAYEKSEPIVKMRELGNFWMLTENMLQKVWSGEDAEECLYELYEQCMSQLGRDASGTARITDPEPVDIRSELTGGD
ncbi:MAG: hypothetical protein IJ930_01500 [Lachnospiraceae bacterium]|nr:hypothetical protein [Lachnospiraceae bacterium]